MEDSERTDDPQKRRLYQRTATLGWVISIAALILSRRRVLFSVPLSVVGIAAGVIALRGTRKIGKEKIQTPAIIGLVLNSLVLLWVIILLATIVFMA